MFKTRILLATFAFVGVLAACGSGDLSSPPEFTVANPGSSLDNSNELSPDRDSPFISATLGQPISGYDAPVDLAIRPSDPAQTFVAEQGGLIHILQDDGSPGRTAADLTTLTEANGEQGLLGLVFDLTGDRAFVNYTNLDGDTSVDQIDVDVDGIFLIESRQTIYTLTQPYRNHNGGDLLLMPDGNSILVFNGDGGSANDPERRALDPATDLGKIIQLDISQNGPTSREWARGLRNPWRASYDPATGNLWIADVGQNMWEEINVVALNRSQGASFGWSAYEGLTPFNDDQLALHERASSVNPVYTYPHENDDCSVSGGFVYRGDEIPHLGSWYFFTDYCSGKVRALCVVEDEVSGDITSCGIISLGITPSPVGIMSDALGRPWVLSSSGSITPIIAEN